MPANDDTQTETETDKDTEPTVDHAAEAEKWKALSRKHEQQAKANADKAKRFDAIEDENKSEQQKLVERAEAAERKAQEADVRALRLEVATEKGLTAAQAKRLVGTSKEDLEADADELIDTFKPPETDGDDEPDKGRPAGGRPVERLKGGGQPSDEPETDVRKAVAAIPRGL